jgi:hypothetical protein
VLTIGAYARDGCDGREGAASFRQRPGLDHAAAMILVALAGRAVECRADRYGTGQASRHQEIIERGSLRGRSKEQAGPRGLSSVFTATGHRQPTGTRKEGHHDEAIASRAGISTTSVRRHIKAIMDKLGVNSRFAVGAAAQRRGWIG